MEKTLDLVGLSEKKNSRIPHLSGGEKQRTAIGRAIMQNPDIYLADEPTGALDEKTGQKIMNLLKRIHAMGKTVLLITHDPDLAAQCGRILYLKDGKLYDEA